MPPKRKRDYFDMGRGGGKRRTVTVARRRRRKSSLYYRRRNMRTAGFLSIERKFYDTALASTAITAPSDASGGEMDPSATSMISTPAVGDSEQNRDGKQIVCLYLEIVGKIGTIGLEATTGVWPNQSVYLAIVLDKQTNGAQLNSEDVFKNLANTSLMATCPLRNLLFGKRFRILKEQVFNMNNNSLAQLAANDFSTNGLERSFKWFIPLRNLKINFNSGTTSSIANVIDNSIHVIAYTNSTTGAPFLTYNARLRFMG